VSAIAEASGQPSRMASARGGEPVLGAPHVSPLAGPRVDRLISSSCAFFPRNRSPDTIAGWKAVADGLLSDQCCAFHRNLEIS
jgi:hypothetical protein